MSMFRKRPGHTVRPIQPVRPSGILCVVGFFVAGAAVYWGPQMTAGRNPATSSHTATAKVVHAAVAGLDEGGRESSVGEAIRGQRPSSRPAEAGRSNASSWNPRGIENRIASEANVRQTIERLKPTAGNSAGNATNWVAADLKRNLRVRAAETTPPGGLSISISCSGLPPDDSIRLVNGLAESYVERFRTEWKQLAMQAHAATRAALGRAEQESRDAQERMDSFSEQHMRQPADAPDVEADVEADADADVEAEAEAASIPAANDGDLTAEPIGRPAAVAAAPKPVVSADPAWLELNTRLAELRRRHAELLIDRTPLHPEVQYVATKIAVFEEQLATLAEPLPAVPAEVPQSAAQPPVPEHANASAADPSQLGQSQDEQTQPDQTQTSRGNEPDAAAVEEFRRLKDAANQADQTLQRAIATERRVRMLQEPPGIEIEPAPPIPAPPARSSGWAYLLAAMAAATAAGGLGLVTTGASMEIAWTSIAQARVALRTPVAGVIPPESTSQCTRAEKRGQAPWQRRYSRCQDNLRHGASPRFSAQYRPAMRAAAILGGLLLMVVCVGVAVVAFWG